MVSHIMRTEGEKDDAKRLRKYGTIHVEEELHVAAWDNYQCMNITQWNVF
jgi:hypothetical protein